MELIVGKTAGFCFGITNAVEKTLKELKTSHARVYCLGELTHNKQVIQKLEKLGLETIDSIQEAQDNATVIIRAHGVPKMVYEQAESKNINLVDLTCPKVLKIHKEAEEYANNAYYIFLMAEPTHPETIGTISFCGKNSCIINSIEDIQKAVSLYEESQLSKCVVIEQTTYSVARFTELLGILEQEIKNLEIKYTICDATNKRQAEMKEMVEKVDYMIVIGGRNSSNTQKLYEIAKNKGMQAIHIETKEELELQKIQQYERIGIMAGASTPKESIEEVIEVINENCK